MNQYSEIQVHRTGSVDHVVLSRPQCLNTLTVRMVDELDDYFGRLRADPECAVVILSGAGEHFCAGLDLKAPTQAFDAGPAYAVEYMKRFSEVVLKMRRCPQPVLAALRGAVSGGGFVIACAADLRFADPSARMNSAFVRLGLSASELGLGWLLPRLIGAGRAADMLLTNRAVGADEALAMGLVSRVHARDDLTNACRTTAEQLAALPPLALRLSKDALNFGLSATSLEQVTEFESRSQALCLGSGAVAEGRSAFLEKRAAVFPEQRLR
jgi:enoyl-CoA hydratase/carnithine racemase